jgi:hypothetical protein
MTKLTTLEAHDNNYYLLLTGSTIILPHESTKNRETAFYAVHCTLVVHPAAVHILFKIGMGKHN